MYRQLENYCDRLAEQFDSIPAGRKQVLDEIAGYVARRIAMNERARLVYVCTHNSRRSQFGQVWAQVAAKYYGVPRVDAFSGGTEVTSFHRNAINALERAGFRVKTSEVSKNPLYKVYYDDTENYSGCFSKLYTASENPKTHFAAIMTCSEAEENCPFIPGADLRIATPYEDPKSSDATTLRDTVYDERCRQIALECLYLFSKLKHDRT